MESPSNFGGGRLKVTEGHKPSKVVLSEANCHEHVRSRSACNDFKALMLDPVCNSA